MMRTSIIAPPPCMSVRRKTDEDREQEDKRHKWLLDKTEDTILAKRQCIKDCVNLNWQIK